MVRTRGCSRFRPRVRFSTPKMEDPDTSGDVGAHSPDLPTVAKPTLAPAAFEMSLRDSGHITRGWDPGPLPRCLRDEAGGSCSPSGPGHQARGSPRDLDPSRHLPKLMRAHPPNFQQPRGSSVLCSPVT